MMQWLPRTLFSRMLGILLLGLILAQALNRAIHLYEHHKMAAQSSQLNAARRVADLIRLLSALNTETKQAIVEQYHDPSVRLQLAKQPLPSSRIDEPNNPKFKLFRSTLNELLSNQPPTRISINETLPYTLLLHVYLADGSTLILNTDLSYDDEQGSSVLLHLAIILSRIFLRRGTLGHSPATTISERGRRSRS
jgi:hypothetical protein